EVRETIVVKGKFNETPPITNTPNSVSTSANTSIIGNPIKQTETHSTHENVKAEGKTSSTGVNKKPNSMNAEGVKKIKIDGGMRATTKYPVRSPPNRSPVQKDLRNRSPRATVYSDHVDTITNPRSFNFTHLKTTIKNQEIIIEHLTK